MESAIKGNKPSFEDWAQYCSSRYEAHKADWEASAVSGAHSHKLTFGWAKIHPRKNQLLVCRIQYPFSAIMPSAYLGNEYRHSFHFRDVNEFLGTEIIATSTNPTSHIPLFREEWQVYATCDNLPLVLMAASHFGGTIVYWNENLYDYPPQPVPAQAPPAAQAASATSVPKKAKKVNWKAMERSFFWDRIKDWFEDLF